MEMAGQEITRSCYESIVAKGNAATAAAAPSCAIKLAGVAPTTVPLAKNKNSPNQVRINKHVSTFPTIVFLVSSVLASGGKVVEFFALALIALALSVDSFVAGASYGVRNIKLPLLSLAIISLMSMVAITVSMMLGYAFAGYFSPTLARKLGGTILILIGLWVLIQSLQGNGGSENENTEDTTDPLVYIRIRALGLAVQILREPSKADLDRSGTISPREAVLLGLALAMDAFGAGIAISMLGFNIIFTTLLVGLCQFMMINAGLITGIGMGATKLSKKMCHLPGIILITLGLFKIY